MIKRQPYRPSVSSPQNGKYADIADGKAVPLCNLPDDAGSQRIKEYEMTRDHQFGYNLLNVLRFRGRISASPPSVDDIYRLPRRRVG